MDTAFLVTDHAERGARFLAALAASPAGPATAAYWYRRPPSPYDEEQVSGDWELILVLPTADGGWQWDRTQYAEIRRAIRATSSPRLNADYLAWPLEGDPVASGVLNVQLAGDKPRYLEPRELGIPDHLGGVYMYPPSLLGRAAEPQAREITTRPVAAPTEAAVPAGRPHAAAAG